MYLWYAYDLFISIYKYIYIYIYIYIYTFTYIYIYIYTLVDFIFYSSAEWDMGYGVFSWLLNDVFSSVDLVEYEADVSVTMDRINIFTDHPLIWEFDVDLMGSHEHLIIRSWNFPVDLHWDLWRHSLPSGIFTQRLKVTIYSEFSH